MNKRELALLERAFDAEVGAALHKGRLYMIQTKSKLAEKLVDDGLLQRVSESFGAPLACTVHGYALTEAGRMTYCMSCDSHQPAE